MVTLTAQIVHTEKKGIHIYIRVLAGDPTQDIMFETGYCIMALVVRDPAGYSVEIPSWE